MVKANIEDDPTPPMPFSMIEKMMPMYPIIALMGFMVVALAWLIGLFLISPGQVDFFNAAKAVREASASDALANQAVHVLETWVVEFKFLGLGLGLMAITMALGTIAKRLRKMGKVITYYFPEDIRPTIPEIPRTVRIFQIATMMGLMILILTFILGLFYAFGPVTDYYSNTVATLNAATGAPLLAQLADISQYKEWIGPLRFLGMAMLFLAITIALTVIIDTLRKQNGYLADFQRDAQNK